MTKTCADCRIALDPDEDVLCGDCAADVADPCSGGHFYPSGYRDGNYCMNCEAHRVACAWS
jgi:hypothetical protein